MENTMKKESSALINYYYEILNIVESQLNNLIISIILGIFILLANLDKGEFKTIFLIVIFEVLSLILSKYSINFLGHKGIAKYQYIINSSIILGVHICVGLCVLGVYIAQLSF